MKIKYWPLSFFLLILIFLANSVPSTSAQTRLTQLSIEGLDAPVKIVYNDFGVPHIYAETAHDLFMAQGYVEASDRFWQMEWWRHQSAGRLSEIVGESAFEQDQFYRLLNFEAMANRAIEYTDPLHLAWLDAYVDGVNAYLSNKSPDQVAIEYQLLAERGMTLEVEQWTRQDTLRWLYVQALGFSENFRVELARAELIERTGPLGALLLPAYPYDIHPVITEPGAIDYRQSQVLTSQTILPSINSSPQSLQLDLVGEPVLPFGDTIGRGSNAWVISGALTDTGLPYSANDPHLSISNPSVWYEIGLYCVEVNEACPFELSGFSQPGVPGIYLGNNRYITWGLTNAGVDVQDLYILQRNPNNLLQYRYNNEWRDFEVREETFIFPDGTRQQIQLLDSVWGPVIAEVYQNKLQALALRWSAYDGKTPLSPLFNLLSATNWQEFVAAAESYYAPVMNITYADVQGNIGYIMPGLVPIRAEGHNGRLPIDGSSERYQWQGYIPFEELPRLFNPSAGYIVSANNAIVDQNYPYPLIDVYSYGYRARRIETLIQTDEDGIFTMEDMRRIQGDTYNQKIEFLMPALEALPLTDPIAQEALAFLRLWDGRNDIDSPQAALFEALWYQLLQLAIVDDLGSVPAGGGDLEWYLVSMFIDVDALPLWDNRNTLDIVETRQDILTQALIEAWNQLVALLGDDPQAWSWGAIHMAHFVGRPFGNDTLGEIDRRFVVSVPTGGGDSIVNATGWTANDPFNVRVLPSMRQIYSLADWDATLRINPPGQSGDPRSLYYRDQVEMWANVDYRIAPFSQEAIKATTHYILVLVPAS